MSGASLIDALAVRVGFVSQTAAKLTAVALQDTGVLDVSCSGSPGISVSALSGIGTDHPSHPGEPILFYSHIDITGLTAGTYYTWEVTKNGHTVSGSFSTLPAASQDFSFVVTTCEASDIPAPSNGMSLLRQYVTDQQVSFHVHVDDLLYADTERSWGRPATRSGDVATGLRLTKPQGVANGDPQETGLSADYCINWARYFGLIPDDTYTAHTDRMWMHRNVPFMAQWGDHEVASNWNRGVGGFGLWFGGPAGYSTAPGFTASPAGFFDNVSVVNWEALFGQSHPAKIGASGQHWGFTQGPLCVVACDMNTFADGRHGLVLASGTSQGTGKQVDGSVDLTGGISADLPYLGTQQITDILNFFNASDKPFNILFTANGITSHNEPWGQFWPTDFLDLMTRASIGVLNNPRLNGTTGKLVVIKGDTHALHVTSYHSNGTAAGLGGAGHTGKELWEVCSGTVNGSSTANVSFPYLRYAARIRRVKSAVASNARKVHGFVHVTVRASSTPQELELRLIDTTDGEYETLWSGVWRSDTPGNAPVGAT